MQAAFVILLVAGLVMAANAHGGSFHEWPGTPSQSNAVRAAVATCDTWVPARPAVTKLVTRDAALNPANITGNGTMWVYLYKNCSDSPSVGMELDVTLLAADGTPGWSGYLDGFVQTGACSAGGGAKYYFNNTAVPLNDSANMLFFEHYKVPANGSVRGIGSNDGNPRMSGTNAAKSYVLYNHNSTEALFCCDLQVTNPAITNWTAQLDGQGKDCSVESDEDHTDHDGHDHSAMNATGVNATGVNATGSAAARNSAAAAGASMAVLLGSLALAAFL